MRAVPHLLVEVCPYRWRREVGTEIHVNRFAQNLSAAAVASKTQQIDFPEGRGIKTERHHVGLVHRVTSGMYHISECHKTGHCRGGNSCPAGKVFGAAGDIHRKNHHARAISLENFNCANKAVVYQPRATASSRDTEVICSRLKVAKSWSFTHESDDQGDDSPYSCGHAQP